MGEWEAGPGPGQSEEREVMWQDEEGIWRKDSNEYEQVAISYGEQLVLVNARSAESALRLAVDFAPNLLFPKISDIDDARAAALARGEDGAKAQTLRLSMDKAQAQGGAGGGAWVALICRLGYRLVSEGGSRSEHHSEYHGRALKFVSAMPHGRPHASDDPQHWRAARSAMKEREALAALAPAPAEAAPRKPRL